MAEKDTLSLTGVISAAMKIPGIRVDRGAFLKEQFKEQDPIALKSILEFGPVAAGCDRDVLRRKADKVILGTTLLSTGVSFLAGLPGGLAMAATIPADILQFYAAALKLAQEIAYIYGEGDLWKGDLPDDEEAINQLILYCGVMLEAAGAAQSVRLKTSTLTKQTDKKVPQKALTKTFYNPIIKSVLKFFGVKLTKDTFAKGVSKAIPVLGGIVSGGVTFASLRPMGTRLMNTFDKAHFSYSDIDIQNDIRDIEEETARIEAEAAEEEEKERNEAPEADPAGDSGEVTVVEEPEDSGAGQETEAAPEAVPAGSKPSSDLDLIRKAKQLLDDGIIDEKEFAEIKSRIISNL